MSAREGGIFGSGPGATGPRAAAQSDIDRARSTGVELTGPMVEAATVALAAQPGNIAEALRAALAFAPYPARSVSPAEAARRMEAVIREISEASYSAGWNHEIEYEVWDWLTDELATPEGAPGPGLDARDIDDLRRYAQVCGGWIRRSDEGFDIVPMAEWLAEFDRWRRAQPLPETPEERELRFEETLRWLEELTAKRSAERAMRRPPRTNEAVTVTTAMLEAGVSAIQELPDASDEEQANAVISAALSVAPFLARGVTPKRAVEQLREHISRICEDTYHAGWLEDVEHRVWRELSTPSDRLDYERPRLDDDDAPTLRFLSAVCEGWVRLGNDGVEHVPMAKWLEAHAHWLGAQRTKGSGGR